MTIASAATTSSRLADLIDGLDGELARWQTPGLSIAVVEGGEVVFAGGVGRGSEGDENPVGAGTLFHHGSCCKAYTSLLTAVLHEGGVLDLDAPVRRWVPELRLPNRDVAAKVTVRDLLAHRSGISRHDLAWILNPSWDRRELVGRLEHLPLAAGLRERWEYSNLGYALAGLVIERATDSSWAEQLREHVFGPLGMARAATSAAQMQQDADAARPHVLRGGKPTVIAMRELVGAAPAGSLMTSADDAARWLLLQAGAVDCVSASAVASTHEVAAGLPTGMQPLPQLEMQGYALGWLVAAFRGRPVLYHSGGIDGFSTQTFVLPRQRAGVTVSANMNASMLPMAAALQIVDAMLDTTESTSWSETLHPMLEAARAAAAQPQPQTPADGPARSAPEIAGTYRNLGYGDLTLAEQGDGVRAHLGESELSARPLGGSTWELRYDVLDAAYPVTFEADPAGRVSTVLAPFDPTSTPIRFTRQGP